MNAIHGLVSNLQKFRSVLLVVAAVLLGLSVPVAAPFIRTFTPVIVAFLVYSSLVGVSFSKRELSRSATPIVVVLVISYGVVPFVGSTWGRLVLPDGMLLGLVAILAAPATAGSAIVWTRLSGGNEDVAGLATVLSLVSAPVITPGILRQFAARDSAVLLAGIEWQLSFIVLAAVVLVLLVPRGIRNETTLNYVTAGCIGSLIYAAVGTTGMEHPVLVLSQVGTVAIVVLLAATVVGVVYIVAVGGTREDLVAIVFSGALKNLGIALLIVLASASPVALSTVIGYYVCQQILSALIVDGFSSRWDAVESVLLAYSRR